MNEQLYLEEVRNLLCRLFHVRLTSHGNEAALCAHRQGVAPGQFVLSAARNDSLQAAVNLRGR